jgi:hypothetical protein
MQKRGNSNNNTINTLKYMGKGPIKKRKQMKPPLPLVLSSLFLLQTTEAAWPGKAPGNGRVHWIYPHKKHEQPFKIDDQLFSNSVQHRLLNPIKINQINVHPEWTQQYMQENNARPRFVERYDENEHMLENSRVHTGRLLFPGWESNILNTQHFEDPHYKWIHNAKDGSTISRTVQQLPKLSEFNSFIEKSRILPLNQALRLRKQMIKKYASPTVTMGPATTKKNHISAPRYTEQKDNSSPRFAQVGTKAGSGTKVGAGADPWWLNPPPWWLPPPPEWGSPPPSVYSPFYSPASIQQPVSASPAHNSYPVYTPKPAPY